MNTFPSIRIPGSLILLIFFSLNCGQKVNTNLKKEVGYFEGIITYKILYRNNKDADLYGDTMKVYNSKGNLLKEYNGTSPKGLRQEIFFGSTNKYYMRIGAVDSLYSYDITKNDIVLISEKHLKNDTSILGYACDKIEFNQLHSPSPYFYVYSSYSFSDSVLKVDKKYFKDWTYGSFNKFINEAGSFYLRFQTSTQYYSEKDLVTKIFEVVQIEHKPIDPAMFRIDTTRITKFKY